MICISKFGPARIKALRALIGSDMTVFDRDECRTRRPKKEQLLEAN